MIKESFHQTKLNPNQSKIASVMGPSPKNFKDHKYL